MSDLLLPIIASSGGVDSDPLFKNTSLILAGEGANGGQNATFIDSSPSNLTVTRTGNMTQGTFSPFSKKSGKWSVYFTGGANWLQYASNVGLQYGTGDFTMEAWVYLNTTVGVNVIYDSRPTSTQGAYPLIYFNGTSLIWQVSGSFVINATTTVVTNNWYHIAACRSGTSTKLFVNGSQVGTTYTDTTSYTTGTSSRIGSSSFGDAAYFNGYISNFRIIKGSALYTTTFIPPDAPLTAITNTQLLTCQENYVKDNSTNNFSATINGNAVISPHSAYPDNTEYDSTINGGGYYSDASTTYFTVPYNTTNFDWYTSGVDFTIEAWVYPTTLTGWSYTDGSYLMPVLIGNRNIGSLINYWAFGPTSNGSLRFYYFNGAGIAITFPTTLVKINEWTHIAMTKTSSGITVFLNGIASTTTAISGTPQSSATETLTVGRGNNTSLQGYFSDIRIVKGTALYSGNFTVPSAPLTAVTNTKVLFKGINSNILDSTKNNDIFVVGQTQSSTVQKKNGTASILFDGTGDFLQISNGPIAGNVATNFNTGDFCIEAWIYPTDFSVASRTIFCKSNGGVSSSLGWFVIANFASAAPYYPYFGYGNSTASEYHRSTVAISLNTWTHVAATRQGNVLTIWINGASGGSTSTTNGSANHDKPLPAIIGSYDSGGSLPYLGYIDDLRITKGNRRYTSAFTPPTRLIGR